MEWSKFASKQLAVREWMSLLAEALGVAYEDRYTTYWHLGDPAEIVRALAQRRASWGWSGRASWLSRPASAPSIDAED